MLRHLNANPARAVLVLIVATGALRIAVAAISGLGFDESYMVANARVFALSYVDAPPLHVWLVGALAKLAGSESPLLLRLPFIALFAGSTWLMYRLTERLFGARAGLWAALAFNLAPVFTLAHASWVLPDGPLIFFMLATAHIVAGILFTDDPSHPDLRWFAAGVCGGLATLAKFHGAFLFLAILAFLLTVRTQRRWLATAGPWLGALAGALVFSPVVVWNFQHGLTGVLFQADRLSASHGLTLRWLPMSVGGQILYLTPWLFLPLAYYLAKALWRGPAAARLWFLGLLAIGPIVFFTGAALFARGLPHWPMPGWLFAFPILGEAAASLVLRWPRLLRYGAWTTAALLLLAVTAMGMQARNSALSRAVPGLFHPRDPTIDLLDWTGLGPALAERGLIDAQTPAVAASYWTDAGKANYAIGRTVQVLCLCLNPQQFAYAQNLPAFVGRDLILVGTKGILASRKDVLFRRFERVEPLAPVVLMRGGVPALELQLYRGVGFKG